MSYGYSQRLAEACSKADSDSVGRVLGRLCLKCGVPVNEVAERFGVSRTTVYNWFWGLHKPKSALVQQILPFIEQLKLKQ